MSHELGVYNSGRDQWEVLTEQEAISRCLLNIDRGLNNVTKVAIGVTTAAAVLGGGYYLYTYCNSKTGREIEEVLTEEEAPKKGLKNGQRIVVGPAAAAMVAADGYFLYKYYNPATGEKLKTMLTDNEAKILGLTEANKIFPYLHNLQDEAPPIVQGQNISQTCMQQQYFEHPYNFSQSYTYGQEQPVCGQQP